MAIEIYMATVQIAIHPDSGVEDKAGACDWFSGLLTENKEVLDWSYLKLGGQFLTPSKRLSVDLDDYNEGEIFE